MVDSKKNKKRSCRVDKISNLFEEISNMIAIGNKLQGSQTILFKISKFVKMGL